MHDTVRVPQNSVLDDDTACLYKQPALVEHCPSIYVRSTAPAAQAAALQRCATLCRPCAPQHNCPAEAESTETYAFRVRTKYARLLRCNMLGCGKRTRMQRSTFVSTCASDTMYRAASHAVATSGTASKRPVDSRWLAASAASPLPMPGQRLRNANDSDRSMRTTLHRPSDRSAQRIAVLTACPMLPPVLKRAVPDWLPPLLPLPPLLLWPQAPSQCMHAECTPPQ